MIIITNPKRHRSFVDPASKRIPRLRFGLVSAVPCLPFGLVLGLMWLSSALHAQQPQPPSGVQWIDPAGLSGSLVIHGGGDLTDAVRDKFLNLAGDKAARIVVIPTASDRADSDDSAVREKMLE